MKQIVLPKEISNFVAKKYNVSSEYVENVYNSYFKEIRNIVNEIDFEDDTQLKDFRIPVFGRLVFNKSKYDRYKTRKTSVESDNNDSL